MRLLTQARIRLRRWLSPERLRYKALASAAVLASLVVVFGTWTYRIEASGELMTDSVQVVSAPFDGYLAQVNANLGDTVDEGMVLAELDTRELTLQSTDLQSEVRRYQAEADQARAASQVAETQIAMARMAQSQARMEQVIFQLKQARIAAPFSGVIVEGERKELSGSPMRQGDKLFRLARIEGLYALIHISERDIRELPLNATGELRLLGQPERTIRFTAEKLVPIAQFKGMQAGHFALKVRLDEHADWWRPGMAALARIEAGERRIIWIWTHKLIDTLHMMLWW
nr:efflux RND transporter periplasmic adaptor subunit [Malikia spinosa]